MLEKEVLALIEEAREEHPPPAPLPGQTLTLVHPEQVLVRLKVEYTGFFTINNQRFGQRFVGQVANPSDILLFHKARKQGGKEGEDADEEAGGRKRRKGGRGGG